MMLSPSVEVKNIPDRLTMILSKLVYDSPENKSIVYQDGATGALIIISKRDGYVCINGGEIKGLYEITGNDIYEAAKEIYMKALKQFVLRDFNYPNFISPMGLMMGFETVGKTKNLTIMLKGDDTRIKLKNTNVAFDYLKEFYASKIEEDGTSKYIRAANALYQDYVLDEVDFIEVKRYIAGETNSEDKCLINGKEYKIQDVSTMLRYVSNGREELSILTEDQVDTLAFMNTKYNEMVSYWWKEADSMMEYAIRNQDALVRTAKSEAPVNLVDEDMFEQW